MQYLITGAAGFIGSYLCHKLAKEGSKVIAVDSYSNYYDVGLKNNRVKALLEPLKVDVINLDITDYINTQPIRRGFDGKKAPIDSDL